jgi:hypothetical protein
MALLCHHQLRHIFICACMALMFNWTLGIDGLVAAA